METIDINKVAGLQALDAEGNALGIISLENLTDMVASRMATELASQNTAMPAMRTMSLTSSPVAASVAATGVDKTEAELSDVSDPGYVRVIDKTGNSGKQGMQQFASVVGGLLPLSDLTNNGLMAKGTMLKLDVKDLNYSPLYLSIKISKIGGNFIMSTNRPGSTAMMLVSCGYNATMTGPGYCSILNIGYNTVLESAKYIHNSDGTFLEIEINDSTYMETIYITSFIEGCIRDVNISQSPISDVPKYVDAVIKNFNNI